MGSAGVWSARLGSPVARGRVGTVVRAVLGCWSLDPGVQSRPEQLWLLLLLLLFPDLPRGLSRSERRHGSLAKQSGHPGPAQLKGEMRA